MLIYSIWSKASKQTSMYTHTLVQCSPTSVGLAQTCPYYTDQQSAPSLSHHKLPLWLTLTMVKRSVCLNQQWLMLHTIMRYSYIGIRWPHFTTLPLSIKHLSQQLFSYPHCDGIDCCARDAVKSKYLHTYGNEGWQISDNFEQVNVLTSWRG